MEKSEKEFVIDMVHSVFWRAEKLLLKEKLLSKLFDGLKIKVGFKVEFEKKANELRGSPENVVVKVVSNK